jgi:bifunctional oligoribonuclease and PAP phosphatase NrnA
VSSPSTPARAEVAALIRGGARFAVTCHLRPDADALGSALALGVLLRELGREAAVYSVDEPPRVMRFVPGALEVSREVPGGAFDACFVADAAAAPLVPPRPQGLRGPVVMIDHHAAHDDFGDVVLREPDACATGLVVVRLMRELGLAAIPRAAALPLYAAIASDTGGFRYSSTDPETHRVAAELLELGVEPWSAASHLFERWEPERMKLLGRLLAALRLELDGRVAVLEVRQEDLREVGADAQMVEGMVNYGRMLDGVQVAALLWEQPHGVTKLSLRAAGGADVSRVAKALGGGGHHAAAGANVDGDLAASWARVRALIEPLLEPR